MFSQGQVLKVIVWSETSYVGCDELPN